MSEDRVSILPKPGRPSKQDQKDAQKLIRAILSAPIRDDPIAEIDGNISLNKLTKMNTTIQTRIILQMSTMAMSGDIKAAEFLFKYGGFEPPKEHDVSVRIPVFLDDMSMPITDADEEALFAGQEPLLLEPCEDDDDEDEYE